MNDILIASSEANQRLDKFLLKYMNKSSKSFIYKMLRKKRIKLNGKKALGSEILCVGDNIKMYLSEETITGFMQEKKINPLAGKLDIVFEDENILVCNKPAGVLSQAEKAEDNDTVVDRLLNYMHQTGQYEAKIDSVFTPAICNRLDRNTSGLILCGKNLQSVQVLNELTRQRKIEKYYICAVYGKIEEKMLLTGQIEKDISSNIVTVLPLNGEGKEILTEIEPIEYIREYTIIRIKLITGKTHQIRAHMKSIGHPVLGDRKYGDMQVNNLLHQEYGVASQLLHAHELIFCKSDGFLEYLSGKSIKAPMPLWYNIFEEMK